jgi:hypothetical protein
LLRKNNINPFNFGDVSGVVREVLENRMKWFWVICIILDTKDLLTGLKGIKND